MSQSSQSHTAIGLPAIAEIVLASVLARAAPRIPETSITNAAGYARSGGSVASHGGSMPNIIASVGASDAMVPLGSK